jgi:flagellar hook-associated protein 3 FlgL
MVERTYLSDLQTQQENIFRLQQQAATGRRLIQPSDDPGAAIQSTGIRTALQANDQYQSNLADARAQVDHTTGIIQTLQKLVSEAHGLALKGANGSTTADARSALAKQVNDLIEEASDQANDSSLGRYTFAGVNTQTAPYAVTRNASGQITAVTTTASAVSGSVVRQIGTAMVKVNTGGGDFLGGAGSPAGATDYFGTLIQLRDALASNNPDAVIALQPSLNTLENQLGDQVTVVGAQSRRLDRLDSALQGQALDSQTHLSALENADIAKVALDLQNAQTIYQQALAVGNKLFSMAAGSLLA